ncbi:MAG: hypothetical protein NTX66_03325, partial [Candidatus Falkowbacteria bacterium]|nr:hypothetical protein [Candidatus Falkowbacteria bacterium]
MSFRQIISKHRKLWQKFAANWFYFKTSQARRLIKIFKGLWFLILWPLEISGDLLFAPRAKAKSLKLPPNPKILIIKIDQLGDVLFSTWLLPALKRQWPQSQIDYLINPKSAAVLQNNPNIQKLNFWSNWLLANIPGRQKISLKTRWQKFKQNRAANKLTKKELKAAKYDLIINGRGFWPSSNFLGRSLGGGLVSFDISQFSFLANIIVPYDLKAWEEINYKNLLEKIGVAPEIIKNLDARGQFYNFPPRAGQTPATHPDQAPESIWILSPVSYDPEKTWSPKIWQKFIEIWLKQNPGPRLVISGLKEQLDWLEQIKKGFLQKPWLLSRLNFLTDLNIGQLAELIKNSQGFIGLESFPAHLAIAFKKPTYCLVNSRLFYVPNLSRQKLVDGR